MFQLLMIYNKYHRSKCFSVWVFDDFQADNVLFKMNSLSQKYNNQVFTEIHFIDQ